MKKVKVRFTKRGHYPASRGIINAAGILEKVQLTEGLELEVPESELMNPWFVPVDKALRRKYNRLRKKQQRKFDESTIQEGLSESEIAQMEITGRAIEFRRE